MMELNIESTSIEGVKIINYDRFSDERGSIWTTYIQSELINHGLPYFNHDKFSLSKNNVIRGIHYDKYTYKIVTAVYGEIDQVVVDMREDSTTYHKYIKFRINNTNRYSVLLPPMVGNAFRVISDLALYHYKLSYKGTYKDFKEQKTVKWNDKSININWGIDRPILSERDK